MTTGSIFQAANTFFNTVVHIYSEFKYLKYVQNKALKFSQYYGNFKTIPGLNRLLLKTL